MSKCNRLWQCFGMEIMHQIIYLHVKRTGKSTICLCCLYFLQTLNFFPWFRNHSTSPSESSVSSTPPLSGDTFTNCLKPSSIEAKPSVIRYMNEHDSYSPSSSFSSCSTPTSQNHAIPCSSFRVPTHVSSRVHSLFPAESADQCAEERVEGITSMGSLPVYASVIVDAGHATAFNKTYTYTSANSYWIQMSRIAFK